MAISRKVAGFMDKSSWIRKMFEEGIRLKREFGEDNVFDLSLGNPVLEPPPELKQSLADAVADSRKGLHRYMPNAGLPETRSAVADAISAECGQTLGADDVVMVCGAAGGLNITLKSLLDPGDEVVVFAPYFVEYLFYADNHGGVVVPVRTHEDFTPDLKVLNDAITSKTKAVIINSPNNPTGVVYSRDLLKALVDVIKRKSAKLGHAIYLISDDPYKKIVFDGLEIVNVLELYENSIYISSHSKDLGVPGERIGFVVPHPECDDAENLRAALIFSNRVLGFVNAPGLIQRAIRNVQNVSVDAKDYERKRDYLYGELSRIGYDLVKPGGAFYMYPKTPIRDEVEFVRILAEKKVLAVPGSGFGTPGYMRLSYCVDDRVIEGAVRGLELAFKEAS